MSRDRGIGSIQTPADNRGWGSKIGKILQASFMDGPLVINILTNTIYVTINLFHNFGIIILCVFFMCTYAHNYPFVAWILKNTCYVRRKR